MSLWRRGGVGTPRFFPIPERGRDRWGGASPAPAVPGGRAGQLLGTKPSPQPPGSPSPRPRCSLGLGGGWGGTHIAAPRGHNGVKRPQSRSRVGGGSFCFFVLRVLKKVVCVFVCVEGVGGVSFLYIYIFIFRGEAGVCRSLAAPGLGWSPPAPPTPGVRGRGSPGLRGPGQNAGQRG